MSIQSSGTEWAQDAARRFLQEFSSAAAIDTADYQLCEFVLAAAKTVLEDKAFAAKVGALMEPRRTGLVQPQGQSF